MTLETGPFVDKLFAKLESNEFTPKLQNAVSEQPRVQSVVVQVPEVMEAYESSQNGRSHSDLIEPETITREQTAEERRAVRFRSSNVRDRSPERERQSERERERPRNGARENSDRKRKVCFEFQGNGSLSQIRPNHFHI